MIGFISRSFSTISSLGSLAFAGYDFHSFNPLLLLSAFAFIMLLFSGKVFCAYLCPFGCLTELARKGLDRAGIKLWNSDIRFLYPLRYGMLGLYLLFFLPRERLFIWNRSRSFFPFPRSFDFRHFFRISRFFSAR